MKINCPKCHSTYKVDLPDPGEAGIDVQCGKCLYIFLFSTDIEKPGASEKPRGTSAKTRDSDLSEDQPSEPILPPQKDEDQEVSTSKKQPLQSKKQAPFSPEKDPETSEELELEPIVDDPEPIEIVVEGEAPEESLEEGALDDIWNQAVQEGARTVAESKEKTPTPPFEKPVAENLNKETIEETSLPPEKESRRLPSLEDRQREIDQIIADHQTQQKDSTENPPTEEPHPSTLEEDTPQDKTQEEIDLEERVVINEGEALPNWEEAFLHQSEVEEGWKKAQEQDRILEEQQLADALGKKAPSESDTEETSATDPQEDKQSLVDQIFTETKSSPESKKGTAKAPQPKPAADQKQDEVNQIFAEAKNQEEIDLEEQVVISEGEAMPSWEEAFADQSEVETGWKKAQEKDRIHEEQQLADALGEEYVPSELTDEETPATAMQENEQDLVGQLFEEVRSQQKSEEPPEAKTQDEPLEIPSEKDPSPETQETHVGQHTIPGEIDLMTDLDDLNMKQLVTQAFKEESESQEKAERSTPESTTIEDEGVQEPELTMEDTAEPPQDAEPPSVDSIPELEMESALEPAEEEPELTLEISAEEEPEPVEAIAQEEESEMEPVSELILESAKEEPEDETTLELESLLEAAETPEEVEALIAEIPLEMESEPELTMELPEETEAPAAAQPAIDQESLLEEEGEQIWNDLLTEHDEEEQPVNAETPVAITEEGSEDPFEENDFWDQVLEKDSQESQTAEIEAGQQPVASAPIAQDAVERETLTDEELWKQAFPGEEELEPAPSQYSGEGEEDSQSEPAPLVIEASIPQTEESEDSSKYDEAAYADYDDDDDEFEFERRKRKLGPFIIPHGRRGDLVIGGAMVVFLLLAGSVYFTLQTFAPGELTDIQTAQTKVPEGLTPREVPLDELAGDLISPKPEKIPPADTPGDKGEAILSDPVEILKESPEEKGILKDLAESQILKDTGKSQTAKIDESALQALTGHSITLSTIMPVAYNPTDIRVLSFSVEIQLSNAQSAKRVRESLPVYEEIMNQTVENFLRRKFYNDILYVKEKLQKRLQTAMNQSLKNGRVKKTKFTDFAIQ